VPDSNRLFRTALDCLTAQTHVPNPPIGKTFRPPCSLLVGAARNTAIGSLLRELFFLFRAPALLVGISMRLFLSAPTCSIANSRAWGLTFHLNLADARHPRSIRIACSSGRVRKLTATPWEIRALNGPSQDEDRVRQKSSFRGLPARKNPLPESLSPRNLTEICKILDKTFPPESPEVALTGRRD